MKLKLREYIVQGRYGYWAIDEYIDDKCQRTVMTCIKPRKLAERIADELTDAVYRFAQDNGLTEQYLETIRSKD